MYVSELIEKLKEFPPNMEIVMGEDCNAPMIGVDYLTAPEAEWRGVVLQTVRQTNLDNTTTGCRAIEQRSLAAVG